MTVTARLSNISQALEELHAYKVWAWIWALLSLRCCVKGDRPMQLLGFELLQLKR
jgi:hypothetical protein